METENGKSERKRDEREKKINVDRKIKPNRHDKSSAVERSKRTVESELFRTLQKMHKMVY